MYNKRRTSPIVIIHYYLNNGLSLRKTAEIHNIHYQTLFKWVKLYKNGGKKRLLSDYKRPWNRTKKELEEKIALLKEKNPSLTVRKAKEILEKDGIRISIKGIWGIWKRYGYAGFKKENMSDDFTKNCFWSKEAKVKYEQAIKLFDIGKIKESARILNSIPFLPKNQLILKIPDNLLNIKRRVEKIPALLGEIPYPSYLRKTKNLFGECKKKELHYSAFRVGIKELSAMQWSTGSEEQLKRIEELKKTIEPNENDKYKGHKKRCGSYLLFEPRFALLILEGVAYATSSKSYKAREIAKTCCRMLKRRKYPSPYLIIAIETLYMNLQEYEEAKYWIVKAFNKVDKQTNEMLKTHLAYISLFKGKYRKAANLARNTEFFGWGTQSRTLLFRAMIAQTRGMAQKAIKLSTEALSLSKKEGIKKDIFIAFLIIASSYCSLGENRKGINILRSTLSFIRKNKLKRQTDILEILIDRAESTQISSIKDLLPTMKLLYLVKNGNYLRAFSYARKKGILSSFYRDILFFPEKVIEFLEKGKPTGLPKTILRLPVFNKEIPVYNIRFLGNLIVYKNQKYLRTKLRPKDRAFLIYLALKEGEPDEEIPLENIFRNFWRNSQNPSRNLSHLLVRIKKALKIPSHLLEVSYKKDYPVLINKGIHFITDYDEYQQTLAQAKALLRAGEWGFAKREFIRAFSLFRGEPFRKMYDNWSDDKRLKILFSYETEVLAFAKELKARGRNDDLEKLLKKAKRIVPLMEE